MSAWIKPSKTPELGLEVEIAFWDGCYVIRMFGAYTNNGWYSGQEKLHAKEEGFYYPNGFIMGWKHARLLPEPPKSETQS